MTGTRRPSPDSSNVSARLHRLPSTGGHVSRGLLRVRSPGGRRRGFAAPATRRPSRSVDQHDHLGRGVAACRSVARRLTAALRGSVPTWLGGTHCETGRCPVRLWPFEGLVEAEVCLGAGVRNRRLHRSDRQQDGLWCAARRLLRAGFSPLRRQGRHRFHQDDTQRTRAPPEETGDERATLCRSRGRFHGAHTGHSRSLSPRSGLPNGQAMLGCDNPAFSGCATTRTSQRSHGNDRSDLGWPSRSGGHERNGAMVACILTARITGAVSTCVRPSSAAISPVMNS